MKLFYWINFQLNLQNSHFIYVMEQLARKVIFFYLFDLKNKLFPYISHLYSLYVFVFRWFVKIFICYTTVFREANLFRQLIFKFNNVLIYFLIHCQYWRWKFHCYLLIWHDSVGSYIQKNIEKSTHLKLSKIKFMPVNISYSM